MVEADAGDVMTGALEVEAFLAVELEEGGRVFLDLVVGLHLAQELGDLCLLYTSDAADE